MDKIKILVVDDEEGIVDWVTNIYKDRGYITFGATDGIKAVEIFEKEHPDIVLIDVHMPYSKIDGITTLKRIKKIDKNAVCIMVTRITDNKTVEEARELGALHYIPKPLTMDELNDAINEAVDIVKKGKK